MSKTYRRLLSYYLAGITFYVVTAIVLNVWAWSLEPQTDFADTAYNVFGIPLARLIAGLYGVGSVFNFAVNPLTLRLLRIHKDKPTRAEPDTP